ncbi:Gfo/Idh/MocA family protein [Streptomyces sp. CA-111067]|uniref:Gfo/Idh/MocA family protein n=1 Tax=Streptomyces sp. CA-111067 TaxID=3240046 RepID=UPI003D989740
MGSNELRPARPGGQDGEAGAEAGPLPVVLIGAGKVAHAAHLREIRDLPGTVRLAAVIEADPAHRAAALAGFPGTVAADDLKQAVQAGARAAICCTPWWTHRDTVLECLDLGLPVLCEKPVSLDPAEIDELIEAERRSGVPVAAGYMKRHDPVVAEFIAYCRAHLDTGRRIAVDLHDPNAPHLVDHLMPYDASPFGPQPPPAQEALRRALGPAATDAQREAYARGLGGSLIHQVNIVHAILAGSGRLYGQLLGSDQWAGGSAVACRWRPADGLLVDAAHLRLPGHRRYRETLEFTAADSVALLSMPSPYARDEAATLTVDTWDAGSGLATRRIRTAEPGHTGFRRQLVDWARALAGDPAAPPMPGLTEVREDAAAVREAALRLS